MKIFCVDSRVLSLTVFRVHISEKTVGLVFDKRKLSCTRTHNHLKSLCNFPLRNSARTYYHSLEKSTKNPKKKLKYTLWTLFSIFQYNCKWLVISLLLKIACILHFFHFKSMNRYWCNWKELLIFYYWKGLASFKQRWPSCITFSTEKPQHPVNYDSGKKTRKFYQSCMSESRQRRDQTLADFTDLIRNVSSGDSFNFAVVLEKVHLLDAWPLFTVSVGPNEKSAQDINVARVISLYLL